MNDALAVFDFILHKDLQPKLISSGDVRFLQYALTSLPPAGVNDTPRFFHILPSVLRSFKPVESTALLNTLKELSTLYKVPELPMEAYLKSVYESEETGIYFYGLLCRHSMRAAASITQAVYLDEKETGFALPYVLDVLKDARALLHESHQPGRKDAEDLIMQMVRCSLLGLILCILETYTEWPELNAHPWLSGYYKSELRKLGVNYDELKGPENTTVTPVPARKHQNTSIETMDVLNMTDKEFDEFYKNSTHTERAELEKFYKTNGKTVKELAGVVNDLKKVLQEPQQYDSISTKEAAKILEVHRNTVLRYVAQKRLSVLFHKGNNLRFSRTVVEAFKTESIKKSSTKS